MNISHAIGRAAHDAVRATVHLASNASTTGTGSTTNSSTAAAAATINAADAAGAAANTSANVIPANQQISQAGFLQLISTQLQNQNPLSPTDPTQFVTQIEGLSQVSSLDNLQTSMNALSSSMQNAQLMTGTSLLGHSVLAPGTTGALSASGTLSGAVSAPSGTSALVVAVTDASGALVNAFNVPPASSGLTNFTWNGTDSNGAHAPAGQYTISVNAAVNGSVESLSPMMQSMVQSVTIDPSTQTLNVNTTNGPIPFSSIVSVD